MPKYDDNPVLRVGPLNCRRQRERGTDSEGREYWRIWRNSKNIWSGWATVEEITVQAGKILVEGGYTHTDKPRTLDILIKQWSQEYRDRRDISSGSKDTSLRAMRHVSRLLAGVRLDGIDQATIDEYRDKRLEEGAAPSTILLEYRRLVQAWNWGKKRRYCSGTLPELTVVEYRAYNHYIPTDEEVEKVIALTSRWTITRSRYTSIFLLIAYLTGARLNEIATLTWADVNLERKTLTLKRKRNVGRNRGRDVYLQTIPIPQRLVDRLAAWKDEVPSEPDDSVLTVGRKTAHTHIRVRINRACERAGVPEFTPHGLRYAAIRRFKRAGVPVGDAAEYFSHSPVIMLRIYDEVEPEDLQNAVDKVYGTKPVPAVSESASSNRTRNEQKAGSDVVGARRGKDILSSESPGRRLQDVEPVELHHEHEDLEIYVDWSEV